MFNHKVRRYQKGSTNELFENIVYANTNQNSLYYQKYKLSEFIMDKLIEDGANITKCCSYVFDSMNATDTASAVNTRLTGYGILQGVTAKHNATGKAFTIGTIGCGGVVNDKHESFETYNNNNQVYNNIIRVCCAELSRETDDKITTPQSGGNVNANEPLLDSVFFTGTLPDALYGIRYGDAKTDIYVAQHTNTFYYDLKIHTYVSDDGDSFGFQIETGYDDLDTGGNGWFLVKAHTDVINAEDYYWTTAYHMGGLYAATFNTTSQPKSASMDTTAPTFPTTNTMSIAKSVYTTEPTGFKARKLEDVYVLKNAIAYTPYAGTKVMEGNSNTSYYAYIGKFNLYLKCHAEEQ